MRALVRLVLLGLVVTMLGPVRAAAQPAPAAGTDKTKLAKQYVDAGLAAQNAGDYDTAVTLYSKAYQLVQHPVLIFDMAQAHRLAGHIDQALALYARYLDEEPKGAQAQTARGLVTELEAQKAKQVRAGGKARKAAPAPKGKPAGGEDAGADEQPHDEPVGDSPSSGTLVVKARSQSGAAISDATVMVDEEPRGKLARGKLTLQDLAEGRYTVAIEASGYQRFEQTVTVAAGEPASLDAVLRDKKEPPSSPRTVWKVSLGASVAVVVAGAVYAVHSINREQAHLSQDVFGLVGGPGASVSSGECGKAYGSILNDSQGKVNSFNYETFQRACTWKTRVYLGYLASSVGVLGAVLSLIMLTREPGPSETPPARSHRKKPEIAVAPIVTPDSGGAQLSLTW